MPHDVWLKKGREKKIRNGYPWVQRGEIEHGEGEPGGLVRVRDMDGATLGTGTFNPASRFPVRMLTTQEEPIDQAWFARRLAKADQIRRTRLQNTDSWRVSGGESDGLSGLIIDRYGDHLVVQVRTLGMERLRDLWYPALLEALKPASVYERSDMAGRNEERLSPHAGELLGPVPETVVMHEDGLKHTVLIKEGLKTGFYLDQRQTRRAFEAALKPGDKVLDVFSYTGAFAMRAARAGALPTAVDMNPLAVDTARADAALNGLEFPVVEANAFEFLPSEAPGTYDWILLDPPAIAKTAEKRDSLKWGIWKLAYHALPALKPGGTLIVSACTYQMSLPMLVDTVRLAANDKNVILNLEHMTIQDIDHPAPIQFPEALYLKTGWFRRAD
ncbi:hypothetical protein CCB81_08325 [Armatimonadetes bacterium Uphvl-Ar2]|jgi:23S rRNA (cytosine1962-C5)-methyltransferase|nr:hypothetical protein CCB81_08325 [Armatimonadetes bacterium Uphvl-Ar2]